MERSIHYKLKLLKIHCYIPDESDADEVYLKMNGKKIWPVNGNKYESMKDNSFPLDLEFKVEKGSKNLIEIWDYDVISADDLLGTVEIKADQAGGPFNADMVQKETDHAKYSLEYEIM